MKDDICNQKLKRRDELEIMSDERVYHMFANNFCSNSLQHYETVTMYGERTATNCTAQNNQKLKRCRFP